LSNAPKTENPTAQHHRPSCAAKQILYISARSNQNYPAMNQWKSPIFYGVLIAGSFTVFVFLAIAVAIVGGGPGPEDPWPSTEVWLVNIATSVLSLVAGYAIALRFRRRATPHGFPVVLQPPFPLRARPLPGPRPRAAVTATVIIALVSVLLNAALIAWMVSDPGFEAMGVAFIYVPIVNAILLILFAACIPLVRRAARGASIALYVTLAVGLPLAAIPFDVLVGHT
jgi:hypothetical protein